MLTQRIEIQLNCVFIAKTKYNEFHLEKKMVKVDAKKVTYIRQTYATSWPTTQIQGLKTMFVGSL